MLKDLGDGDFFSGPPGPHPCAESTTHRKNCKSWAKPTKRKEKEMKKMKKFFAMFLALAMVLGMSVTTFAAGLPDPTDVATGTVENVEEGATVTAYRIVKATYVDNKEGFTGYTEVLENTIDDTETYKPTSQEISALSGRIDELTEEDGNRVVMTPGTAVNGKVSYTAQLTAGYWMVLVTESNSTVYNPMLLGMSYKTGLGDDDLADGSINPSANYVLGNTVVYAKSSDVTVEKTATTVSNAVGQEVSYTITGTIPSYGPEYDVNSLKYTMTDRINVGLKYLTGTDKSLVVTMGTGEPATYELEYFTANNEKAKDDLSDATYFVLTFAPSYIQSLASLSDAQRAVTITYKAEITAEAVTVVGENEVVLDYTKGPGAEDADGQKTDKTFTPTFSLDGLLKKVKETADGEILPGAEFTVYDAEGNVVEIVANKDNKTKASVATSDTNGNIYIGGLDDATYTMKETKAPAGYTINNTEYTITFPNEENDRTYDQEGKLLTYKIKITGTDGTDVAKTVTYGQSELLEVAHPIINTTLSSLPSTGGIGTTIFTVGGCAIMIIAAGLYFSLRRKAAK